MKKAKVLVITGYGTNCEKETAHTAQQAGADITVIAHFADILQERIHIADFNFLVFPGGFLDGDHLGAAQAAATRLKYLKTNSGLSLLEEIRGLHSRGGLILGICNGFQLLVKTGLLPASQGKYFEREVSLSYNDSARFEDRWVHLKCNPQSPCVFTRGIDTLYLPVRHGEGKIIPKDNALLQKLKEQELIALQYIDRQGNITQNYPDNPNGSPLGIAGLTDPSGQILGLMPHPEAFNHPTNHPAWTRLAMGKEHQKETGLWQSCAPLGTIIFQRAIEFLKAGGRV